MPKNYAFLPTKDEWKRDLGLRMGILGNRKSPFPAMTRIGQLIDLYHSEPDGFARIEMVFHIYLQTRIVVKNHNNAAKLGGTLTADQLAAVTSLYNFVGDRLADFLNAKDRAAFDRGVLEYFGRDVNEAGKAEDEHKIASGTLQYYRESGDRRQFKLSFRNGLAHQHELNAETGKKEYQLYDTTAQGDALEEENFGSLYVMDGKGHLFVSGKDGEQALKHSSFLAGEKTLAAGTIRFDRGQLMWISGKSGHYKPTVAQMVTALERLSGYGVKLDRVTVYRQNYNDAFQSIRPRWFEACNAKDLLKTRAWPGDRTHGNDMFVDKNP